MYIDSVVINNARHTPKSGHMKRYRWVYMALPVTVMAVLIGIITNEGSDIIRMTVAEESIKAFTVPEEFLTFYYEAPEEEMEFNRSFVE